VQLAFDEDEDDASVDDDGDKVRIIDLSEWSKGAMKDKLRDWGLKVTGNKQQLATRIRDHLVHTGAQIDTPGEAQIDTPRKVYVEPEVDPALKATLATWGMDAELLSKFLRYHTRVKTRTNPIRYARRGEEEQGRAIIERIRKDFAQDVRQRDSKNQTKWLKRDNEYIVELSTLKALASWGCDAKLWESSPEPELSCLSCRNRPRGEGSERNLEADRLRGSTGS